VSVRAPDDLDIIIGLCSITEIRGRRRFEAFLQARAVTTERNPFSMQLIGLHARPVGSANGENRFSAKAEESGNAGG
jgi:hypothetical protein